MYIWICFSPLCLQNGKNVTEGRGSLLYFLKYKGLASSLSAGVGDEGMRRSSIAYIFVISIYLTDSGLEKVCIIR